MASESVVICPKPNICCDGCCNPTTHECIYDPYERATAGYNCLPLNRCDCNEYWDIDSWSCQPVTDQCPSGYTYCNGDCCDNSTETCINCQCIPI